MSYELTDGYAIGLIVAVVGIYCVVAMLVQWITRDVDGGPKS